VFVLIQYKSFSLQKHILSGWDIVSTQLGEFIDIIPAQQRLGSDWYKGTADAIFQNIYAINDHNAELVLILAGDHLYKMDYQKMIEAHLSAKADVTVACIRMPKEESPHFGVIEADHEHLIRGFQEKPRTPRTLPGDPTKIFASMGIYLFNRKTLVEELTRDAAIEGSGHDFGKNILPQMLAGEKRILAYDFHEQSDYWRDIGTRDAYYEANMDLVSAKPPFDLYDKSWPLRTYYSHYPPVMMRTAEDRSGQMQGIVIDSILSPGCIIEGGRVERSVLSPQVMVKRGAEVLDSVIMDGGVIGEGAKIKGAIIDKQVVIPPGEMIGYDLDKDRQRFAVTKSGIVIVPKKTAISVED
ncbi:MAG: glucose-1-phosphate adenylyltransferase, partial [Elusimicrobia bacterium]|nr:glucose-1-phosphate adenylyltransferase [Elusimicrobiota bacterium]